MIKSLRILFVVFISLLSSDIFAQNSVNASHPLRIEFRVREKAELEDVEGSPYIQDDFVRAKVNDIENFYLVRYNAADDVFEFREDKYNSQVMILRDGNDYRITLKPSGKTYVSSIDIPGMGYLVEAHTGNGFVLYIKEVVKYYEAKEASSSYGTDQPARFDRADDEYYVKVGSKPIELIPDKKRKFVDKFGFISSSVNLKKVNPKNMEDLIDFFRSADL